MKRITVVVVAVAGFGAQAWGQDITPPGAPSGLATSDIQEESITFSWTAPFNDASTKAIGPTDPPIVAAPCASYEIRFSTSLITPDSLDGATPVTSGVPLPQDPGTTQSCTITGLAGSRGYYFAIRATDQAGNVGAIAATSSPTTTSADPVAPGAVANLAATELGSSTATIQWTAAADDAGNPGSGPVDHYSIRYWLLSAPGADFNSGTPVPAPSPVDPAGLNPVQSAMIDGLSAGTTYGIGISANDGTSSGAVTTVTITTLADASVGGSGTDGNSACQASARSIGALASLVLLAAMAGGRMGR